MRRSLNLGAGHRWQREGWEVLDHTTGLTKRSQAWDMPYPDETFDVVFSSGMIEHISHFKIEQTIAEINRILKVGGLVRLQTPDLRILAEAYVKNDKRAMDGFQHRGENKDIKTGLSIGHDFMNFLVSSGLDNFMFSNDFSEAYPGYAHVFCYDFEMLAALLKHYGFDAIEQRAAGVSEIEDVKELRGVPYDIDAAFMLNVECRKVRHVPVDLSDRLMQCGPYDLESTRPSPAISLLANAYWRLSRNRAARKVYEAIRKVVPRKTG